jgi:uncharacterized protein with FMN-binding domain
MSTKIIVVQLREIIYTAIFVGLGIFLILLLIFMFSPKKNQDVEPTMQYVPGVYTSSLMIENEAVNVEVIVDENTVKSVRILDLDPARETLYHLLQPTTENISEQLSSQTAIDDVSYSDESKITSSLVLDAIKQALKKAEPQLHN